MVLHCLLFASFPVRSLVFLFLSIEHVAWKIFFVSLILNSLIMVCLRAGLFGPPHVSCAGGLLGSWIGKFSFYQVRNFFRRYFFKYCFCSLLSLKDSNYRYISSLKMCHSSLMLCSFFQNSLLSRSFILGSFYCYVFKSINLSFCNVQCLLLPLILSSAFV